MIADINNLNMAKPIMMDTLTADLKIFLIWFSLRGNKSGPICDSNK